MKLTGKAKDDFCDERTVSESLDWEELREVCQQALVIEWLDSVGYIILPQENNTDFYCELKDYNHKDFGECKRYLVDSMDVKTRQQAIDLAIEKANELYNHRHQDKYEPIN